MPETQRSPDLPGPRMVLIAGSLLLLCASLLPWYRIEGQGFVLEFTGWHDVGVLAWILAIDLLAWELLRLTRFAPVTGDRGDRWSAVGGIVVSSATGLYVLQRLVEGGVGTGWYAGVLIVAALGTASVRLFSDARGPEALTAVLGRGAPPVDEGADEGPPPQAGAGPATGRRLPAPSAPLGLGAGEEEPGRAWSPRGPARVRPAPGTSAPASRPAPVSRSAPGPAGGLWRTDRATPAPRPARRPHPEDAEGPPGGFEKTLAERVRDQPPLWADRDDGRS